MYKVDLAISIGYDCKPAFYLRKSGLRRFSSPMDWMKCTFKNQVELYKKHFEDFFDHFYENIDPTKNDYRFVIDSKNEVITLHHVSFALPLDEAVSEFKNLMMRRYKRLNRILEKTNSILLVSAEELSVEEVKNYVLEFSSIYPNLKIILLSAINYEGSLTKEIIDVNDNIRIIRYSFDDSFKKEYEYDEYTEDRYWWLGDMKVWPQLLEEFEINDDFIIQEGN